MDSKTYKHMAPYLILFFLAMVSADSEIAQDFSPAFLVYKDGHVERLLGNEIVPASFDPKTNVESKDIKFAPETNLSARLFLRKNTNQNQKLPLLVFFHGGAFVIQTPASKAYHNHINSLVSEANIIAVSVDYRRAPENPLPCAHNDSWTALQWVASHVNGAGSEDWLNRYADFQKVFFYGDSAGGNIAHNMGMKQGLEPLAGVIVKGIILSQPFFWGKEHLDAEKNDTQSIEQKERLLQLVYPTASGFDDPLINPAADPNLAKLGSTKVLDIVGGNDFMRHRGKYYFETLTKSGWKGSAEFIDYEGEIHAFNLINPTSANAVALLKKIASFVNSS